MKSAQQHQLPAKTLHIGMTLAATWLSGESWRAADSGVEGILTGDMALNIAKRAEAQHLDFVFCPDTMSLMQGQNKGASPRASLDPTLLLSSIARETSHIGLVTTLSTLFLPAYVVARQLQSLHWLSNGRAGWNIVTALQGHENFGLQEMPTSQDRYKQASEFTDVVRALWDSYPAEAYQLDRATGVYSDPNLIHPIDHDGEYMHIAGPLNIAALPGPRIPLIQAGASDHGRQFAASVADLVFASTPDIEAAATLRADLKNRALQQGRTPDCIKLLPGLSLYLAETKEEALDLFESTQADGDRVRKLSIIREMTNLDLTDWPDQKQITKSDLPPAPEQPRSRTHSELLRRMILRDEPTLTELLRRPEVAASGHWQIVGTVANAVEKIAEWRAAEAIDGFIAFPGGNTKSLQLFFDELIPALKETGQFRKSYNGTSFAGHLA